MKKLMLKDNYINIMEQCFSEDQDLLDVYHIAAPASAKVCAERTADDIKKSNQNFKFFVLTKDNKVCGFFGEETINRALKCMTSFFVKPAYRNKDSLKEVWNLIDNHFEKKPFITGIYAKNTRAAGFYEKNGGTLLAECDVDGQTGLIYIFNSQEIPCL